MPDLAHNLLSVGQLLSRRYSVLFEGDCCVIKGNQNGVQIVRIQCTKNYIFPIDVLDIGNANVITSGKNLSVMWYGCFRHLNYNNLKQVELKQMMHGLLTMKKEAHCEMCDLTKMCRRPFPTERSWKANLWTYEH